jgi:hypothetical protein
MTAADSQAPSSVHCDALPERLRATFRNNGRPYEYYGVNRTDYAALMRVPFRASPCLEKDCERDFNNQNGAVCGTGTPKPTPNPFGTFVATHQAARIETEHCPCLPP